MTMESLSLDRWGMSGSAGVAKSWPLPRTPRPLVERILEDEGLRARYRAYAAEYLERHNCPGRGADKPLHHAPALRDKVKDETLSEAARLDAFLCLLLVDVQWSWGCGCPVCR